MPKYVVTITATVEIEAENAAQAARAAKSVKVIGAECSSSTDQYGTSRTWARGAIQTKTRVQKFRDWLQQPFP